MIPRERERESYAKLLSLLPAFEPTELSLPHSTNILFFGHSFLREVVDNLLIVNHAQSRHRTDMILVNGQIFNSSKPQVREHFPGCNGKTNLSLEFTSVPFEEAYRWPNRWRRVAWRDVFGNASIVQVINYFPLQHPSCYGVLNDFLSHFAVKFDYIFFMNPHGPAFAEYQWRTDRNMPADQPYDLNATALNYTTAATLAGLFRPHARSLVFVRPWGVRGHDHYDRTWDHDIDLEEYVRRRGLPVLLVRGPHVCNPGALTIAARCVIGLVRNSTRCGSIH